MAPTVLPHKARMAFSAASSYPGKAVGCGPHQPFQRLFCWTLDQSTLPSVPRRGRYPPPCNYRRPDSASIQLYVMKINSVIQPSGSNLKRYLIAKQRKALEDCLAQETSTIKYLWRHLLVNDLQMASLRAESVLRSRKHSDSNDRQSWQTPQWEKLSCHACQP